MQATPQNRRIHSNTVYQKILQALFAKEQSITMIEGYHRQLLASVVSFQVS
jgi:hypothetical protein